LNPVVESLRRDFEEQNVVLAEVAKQKSNIWRMQCKITDVNDLYAIFKSIGPEGEVSGAIGQITVSYEPMMKMKMYTVASAV
jgi:hypothetical protein